MQVKLKEIDGRLIIIESFRFSFNSEYFKPINKTDKKTKKEVK